MTLSLARTTLIWAAALAVSLTAAAVPAFAADDPAAASTSLLGEPDESLLGAPGDSGTGGDDDEDDEDDEDYDESDPGGGGVSDIDRRLGHETSGMVVSSIDPDYVFTVDDRRGDTFLGVARTDGGFVGKVQLRDVRTQNVEAMAAGPCNAAGTGRCLYVADIGNNLGRLRPLAIWRLQEPDPRDLPNGAVSAELIEYTYPDGIFDAEAIFVDDRARTVVITKRVAPGRSHALRRMYVGGPNGGRLSYVTTLDLPEPPEPKRSLRRGDLVTDASAADGQVLILTYDQAVLYTAPNAGADLLDFPKWNHRQWSVTRFRAAEAVALSDRRAGARSDAARFVVAGEGFHGQAGQIGVLGG